MAYPINLLVIAVAVILICPRFVTSVKRCPDCCSTPVPYPLSTGPECGDHSYKIRCEAGLLKFDTLNNSYGIISISQSDQRLVIRPSNFLDNTCVSADLPNMGIQLNSTGPFNITNRNTIMYLNCTSKMMQSSLLNCSLTSLCHAYLKGLAGKSACGDNPNCCMNMWGHVTDPYSIGVRDGGCQAYRSFVNLDESLPMSRWPDPGVEIEWTKAAVPLCKTQADCDTNSTCGLAPCGNDRCLCNAGFQWDPVTAVCVLDSMSYSSKGRGRSKLRKLTTGLFCSFGTLLLATVGLMMWKRHQRTKEPQELLAREREEILTASGGRKSGKIFTGKEIKKATNNFSRDRLLGSGGYGDVYKGILEDGTSVAVKCAKLGSTKGTNQLLNEVRILCQVNHKGLVHLLGCCIELAQPLLVYEYISNGSLSDHLNGKKRGTLTWTQRLTIARDTAEGLSYLHFSAVPPIC